MTDTPAPKGSAASEASSLRGRHLLAYYALLFGFLFVNRWVLLRFGDLLDLSLLPKLTAGIGPSLGSVGELDNTLTTLYSLGYAFLFSLPVAIVYRVTEEEDRFDPALGQTIVLLAMVVSAVITVISGDLARAFGLAGVVAAVRFRNNLNDAKDAVYVFLAIAIGMACGARIYSIALWTSLVMTSTLYLMWHYHFGQLPGRILASREEGARQKRNRSRSHAERSIEHQRRLLQFAEASRPQNGKKLNAGLFVEASDAAAAEAHVRRVLFAIGRGWRVASLAAHEGGGFSLEFVGRLPKGQDPSPIVQALVADRESTTIRAVEFHSLRRRDVAAEGDAAPSDAADAPPEGPSPKPASTTGGV